MRAPYFRSPALVPFLLATACSGDESARGDYERPGSGAPLFPDRAPERTVRTDGVSARVEVARDRYGVPHIYAGGLEDAAFAQGYMHATDRFVQIDLYRHLIEGRLSEYFGELTFSVDVGNRSNMMTVEGRPVYEVMAENLDGREKAVLDAYSAGVNLYIKELKAAGNGARPIGYKHDLLAGFHVELIDEWRPADTLAIGRLQEQNLSDSTDEDIARGQAKQNLPPELFADLVRYAPPDPIAILPDYYGSEFSGSATVSGRATPSASVEGAKALYRGLDLGRVAKAFARADFFGMDRLPEGVEGSNNWVISGEHTDTGNALVLNDPHLQFFLPSLFYHSHSDTRHYGRDGADASSIIGISFPGIPGVLIGHNEHVAWGATTVGWDVSDVYVETLDAAGTATLFNGDYVPMNQVPAVFKVLVNGVLEEREHVFEIVPHHGVVMPDSKQNGKAMTRKWTGHEAVSGVGALLDRITARNIDDFMEAMGRFVAGAQNWNGADTAGNTGYMPGARIPIRASVTGLCDPSMPMDGTGPCEWTGEMIPPNEVPRVKNRQNGYVITANNDVTGTLADNDPTNDPQYLHSSNADGFRARRITDRVDALIDGGDVTRAQMVELQADTFSIEAQRLMPFVLAARTAEPALATSLGVDGALDRLAAWNFTMPSGVAADYRRDDGPGSEEIEASIAAAIFNTFRARFYAAAFADEKTLYSASFSDTVAALYVLENQTPARLALFDDPVTAEVETVHTIVLKSLAAATTFLTDRLGADPEAWRWGALHQMEVTDLFGQFALNLVKRRHGPFPRGGGNSTVDVAGTGGSLDDFTYRGGPQMRFVAEVGPNGIVASSSLPGGQIDDPESRHYDDLLPMWLRNETFPYYFEADDVVDHTEELVVIEPE